MRQLRLYQVVDTSSGKPAELVYYNDKMQAKKRRAELNGPQSDSLRFIVSPGPDHRKYKP